MDKKLAELTVREVLALITVLAKALDNKSSNAYSVLEDYQLALDNIDENSNADSDK